MFIFPISRFFRTTGPVILLALVTLAVFSNTFRAPFVLDDTSSIKNNRSIRSLWPLESPSIGGTRGRPVANLSLALNYRMSGLYVGSYHWTNLGIHVAAGLFLLGVIRQTLRLRLFEGRFSNANVRLGRRREAMADYEAALKLRPNLVEARHNLELLRRESAAPTR